MVQDDELRERRPGAAHSAAARGGYRFGGARIAVLAEAVDLYRTLAELARVPGAPNWHLALKSMAWVGRSPRSICEQLKDPTRNGDKTLGEIAEHAAHDGLVAWGWAPGHGRTTPPGDQASFGELIAAWVETGAACPDEGAVVPVAATEEAP